jgi:phospholipase/carboxylesterase
VLSYRVDAGEAEDGAPVLVLLHGRGSDEQDLLGLRPHLPPEWVLVAPRAPFAGAPWGYGPGWAWYRYLDRDRPEPESFRASQAELEILLTELPDALPVRPGPVVLGGFSQGGTMSLAYALRTPTSAPPVLNLSGFLADHPEVRVGEGARGLRVFWGHGTQDPNIPFALAVEGRARLEAAGVALEARDYPIGHSIAPEELRAVVAWIRRQLGG